MYTVIGGPASSVLARKIAKKLDAKYIESEVRIFPDGESKITLSDIPKKDKIVVVQSTPPPVNTNMLHVLSLISKAKQHSSDITAVIPYLGYMRQDIEFLKGEIVTSKIIATLLSSIGTSKIITVDIHSRLAMNYFTVPIINITALDKIGKYLKKMDLKKPFIVAPDLFWSNHANQLGNILGTQSIALNKQRDRKTGKLHIKPQKMDLLGRDVVLFDDMISTGGSIIEATNYLQKRNCGTVYAVCTHALLVEDAEKKIKKIGVKKIISTNTISNKTSLVDVSDVIMDAI